MATYISLFAAESITGLSRRTLWRRVADGVLHTESTEVVPGDAARVDVDEVIALSGRDLTTQDRALLLAADNGVAEAQCDLALLLLTPERDQPASVGGGEPSLPRERGQVA